MSSARKRFVKNRRTSPTILFVMSWLMSFPYRSSYVFCTYVPPCIGFYLDPLPWLGERSVRLAGVAGLGLAQPPPGLLELPGQLLHALRRCGREHREEDSKDGEDHWHCRPSATPSSYLAPPSLTPCSERAAASCGHVARPPPSSCVHENRNSAHRALPEQYGSAVWSSWIIFGQDAY